MSIAAIGDAGAHLATPTISKPESMEKPGAPDHDGDADADNSVAAASSSASPRGAGRVDVKA